MNQLLIIKLNVGQLNICQNVYVGLNVVQGKLEVGNIQIQKLKKNIKDLWHNIVQIQIKNIIMKKINFKVNKNLYILYINYKYK